MQDEEALLSKLEASSVVASTGPEAVSGQMCCCYTHNQFQIRRWTTFYQHAFVVFQTFSYFQARQLFSYVWFCADQAVCQFISTC